MGKPSQFFFRYTRFSFVDCVVIVTFKVPHLLAQSVAY
jgi:hypothetical protein